MTDSSALFTSSNLGKLKLNNRLALAPMTRVSATQDGRVGPMMEEYYTSFARGGFGLIITEGLYTDGQFSQGYLGQPGLINTQQAKSWTPLVQSVQQQGTAIIAQLMHAGALSQCNPLYPATRAPSAVKPKGKQMRLYHGQGEYQTPVAMSEPEIQEAIMGFAHAALLAKEAGFDGVEVHAANGYLLDQFLTDYTNQREDKYGGSLNKRLNITVEVIQAIREKVGADFVVGVRFSQKKANDNEHEWSEQEQGARLIFDTMARVGADFLHITEPDAKAPAFGDSRSEIGGSLAELAKRFSGLPVIANGGVEQADQAVATLAQTGADVLSLGRVALSNPDWPRKAQQGEIITPFEFEMFVPIADLATAQEYTRQRRG